MAEQFTVHFATEASFTVTVDAEDCDDAIGKARDAIRNPSSLVYFGRALGHYPADRCEPRVVTNAIGQTVWSEQA